MLKQLHTLATSSTLEKEIGEKKEKPDNNVFHSFDLTLALSGPWNIPTSSLLHREAIGRTILKTTKNDNNIWLIDYNANKFLTPQLLLLSIETKKKMRGMRAHRSWQRDLAVWWQFYIVQEVNWHIETLPPPIPRFLEDMSHVPALLSNSAYTAETG